MKEYHKINGIFKRHMSGPDKGKFIMDQYAREEFEYLRRCEWIFTEKVDGTNIRIGWDGKEVKFGGRTDKAIIPEHLLQRLNELFNNDKMKQKLTNLFNRGDEPVDVCLYGEGYGVKIQKGMGEKYNPDGADFVLFDIKVGTWWLRRENIEQIAKSLGIDIVPVLFKGSLLDAMEHAKNGIKSSWGDFQAEGYVGTPSYPFKDRKGGRIITKVKCCDFQK